MQFRTEDFTAGDWPPEVIAAIEETNAQLAQKLLSAAEVHHVDPIDMTLAAIDVPATAARRAILMKADPAAEEHIRRRAMELVAHLLRADDHRPPLLRSPRRRDGTPRPGVGRT